MVPCLINQSAISRIHESRTVTLVLLLGISAPLVFCQELATPKTLGELNAWYANVSHDRNAAITLNDGLTRLKISDKDWESRDLLWIGTSPIPDPRYPLSTNQIKAAKEFLIRNRSAVSYFMVGGMQESSRYPIDLEKGANLLLPHLSKLRVASKVLALQALVEANDGHGSASAQRLLAVLGAARSLQAEPILVSQLTRVECVETALKCLEQVLTRAPPPQADLDELVKALGRACEYDTLGLGFKRGLVGSRLMLPTLFGKTAEEMAQFLINCGIGNPEEATNCIARFGGRSFLPEQQFMDSAYEGLLQLWEKSYPVRFSAVKSFSSSRRDSAQSNCVLSVLINCQRIPDLAEREAECIAMLRLAQAAIAVLRHQAGHLGAYPNSLSELAEAQVESILADPLNGKPVCYKNSTNSCTIWAVKPEMAPNGDHETLRFIMYKSKNKSQER